MKEKQILEEIEALYAEIGYMGIDAIPDGFSAQKALTILKDRISVCPLCNGSGRRVFPNCTPPIDEPCPACKGKEQIDIKDKLYVIAQRIEFKRLKPREAVEEICSLLDVGNSLSSDDSFLLRLVDTVWMEAKESEEVPSTIWAKEMIEKTKR